MPDYCKDCERWKSVLVEEDKAWGAYLFYNECCLGLSPIWNEEEECMECEGFTLYRDD